MNRQTYKQTDCHLDQDMFEGTFADAFAKKIHSSYESIVANVKRGPPSKYLKTSPVTLSGVILIFPFSFWFVKCNM